MHAGKENPECRTRPVMQVSDNAVDRILYFACPLGVPCAAFLHETYRLDRSTVSFDLNG